RMLESLKVFARPEADPSDRTATSQSEEPGRRVAILGDEPVQSVPNLTRVAHRPLLRAQAPEHAPARLGVAAFAEQTCSGIPARRRERHDLDLLGTAMSPWHSRIVAASCWSRRPSSRHCCAVTLLPAAWA